MIQKKYPEIIPESFKFELVSDNDAEKETENLDTKKIINVGFYFNLAITTILLRVVPSLKSYNFPK